DREVAGVHRERRAHHGGGFGSEPGGRGQGRAARRWNRPQSGPGRGAAGHGVRHRGHPALRACLEAADLDRCGPGPACADLCGGGRAGMRVPTHAGRARAGDGRHRGRRQAGPAGPGRPVMKLKDKVALITGAGSGIGQATALLFAREGARVAVVDVREEAAKATAQEIERAGGQALALRADVSRAADNQAAVEQTVARWGRLDIFYANAGVPERPTPVEDVDEATFDRIMAVNVKGPFLGVKYAAPIMKRQRSGVILITV